MIGNVIKCGAYLAGTALATTVLCGTGMYGGALLTQAIFEKIGENREAKRELAREAEEIKTEMNLEVVSWQ